MLPIRIYLENFMGHIQSDIDCTQFNSCLIVGKNKNNAHISNGVGKSTIFKAIDLHHSIKKGIFSYALLQIFDALL